MKAVLLDTHTLAWTLHGDEHLTDAAVREIKTAETVFVSSASFYEIAQKVRLGKWREMEPFAPDLLTFVSLQKVEVLVLDAKICLRAGTMEWRHRDPFDRMLAATALEHALPIISADRVFDGVVSRIW